MLRTVGHHRLAGARHVAAAVGTAGPRQADARLRVHMGAFVGLLALGWAVVEIEGGSAGSIRCGRCSRCWLRCSFAAASCRSIAGSPTCSSTPRSARRWSSSRRSWALYAAVRLVLPIAPDWVLRRMGLVSLATAVYAAGMALVQREARRFFCYIFLSHSALVLVGWKSLTPIGLTGALCVWLSVGLSLAGFGLTLRALEARHGRLSLDRVSRRVRAHPALAVCFLLTGLASVGFPGTFGFVGTELLVDGAVEAYPYVGIAVVVAACARTASPWCRRTSCCSPAHGTCRRFRWQPGCASGSPC